MTSNWELCSVRSMEVYFIRAPCSCCEQRVAVRGKECADDSIKSH